MRLEIHTDKPRYRIGERITVRLIAINDSYEPVLLDRRTLIGPTPILRAQRGMLYPVAVEPPARDPAHNTLLLQPFCLYGRERVHDGLPAGTVELRAYLTRRVVERFSAERPFDPADLEVEAAAAAVMIEIDASDGASNA
jgi:hypothetical protein